MKRNIALAFAALIVLGTALPSYAYVLLSPARSWKNAPVTVYVNRTGNSTIADGDGGVSRVAQTIGVWAEANGSTTTGKAVRGDGKPYIELHSSGKICNGSCLAATLTGYYHQEGSAYYIDDADVYTNQRYSYYSGGEGDGCNQEFSIEGIMVHEVGHVIGIGHSNVAGATMYPSVSYCNDGNITLSSDDQAAERALP